MRIHPATLFTTLALCASIMPFKPSSLAAQDSPPLVLKRAEYVRQRKIKGKTTIILEGNVIWTRGDQRLRCGRARYYEEDGLLFLSEDVYLYDKGRTVSADSARYTRGEGSAVAIGGVSVELSGGEVVVTADSMDFALNEGEYWAYKRPRIFLQESGGGASGGIEIRGERSHMVENRLMALSGPVDISGDSLTGGADSLCYDMEREKIFLVGASWIEVGAYRLRGDRIELFVPERVLSRGISCGNARGEETEKEPSVAGEEEGNGLLNWIEADSIALSFRDNRIDSLLAWPDVRSFYQVHRKEGREENYIVGDRILMIWDHGKIGEISVKGRSEGVYHRRAEGAK
jgi:lipopolysaccharide export system protein LptA